MYTGKLVRLRAFEHADAEQNHLFVNDYETLRGMITGIPFPSSREDEQRFVDQQTSYTRGEYQFAVETLSGELIGRCGITKVDWKNSVAELGVMISSGYRRKGYGTDAVHVLCDFCFQEMNLHKLKLTVAAFNTPALRCYEQCGFRREGTLSEEIFRQGKYHDAVILGRLRPSGV
jgi:RimJ/RimL family protein N-acetyltransferase